MDWALNNLQRLICHKTKPNQITANQSFEELMKNIISKGMFSVTIIVLENGSNEQSSNPERGSLLFFNF